MATGFTSAPRRDTEAPGSGAVPVEAAASALPQEAGEPASFNGGTKGQGLLLTVCQHTV